MLIMLLWLLIAPAPGIAGIELNPSDPQDINAQLIEKCLTYTGQCNVWFVSGKHPMTEVLRIPLGVRNVYFQGATLVPCTKDMRYVIIEDVPVNYPKPELTPRYHDVQVDYSKPCNGFVPPAHFEPIERP